MTLAPGSRLGTYEIVAPLGAGGMGEVYRAHDHKLGREVAIKVLPEEFARDSGRVARFEREARMLAAVSHASIAAIYGAEQEGHTRYIVMELVEGATLSERLGGGPVPMAEALRMACEIAQALEVAHEKGVIHRDLKPSNIKITPEGRVKVLDFGLAKAMDLPFAGDMSRSPTIVMNDSRPGDIVGTPEFMSPEQARGKETDRRTDIWSFGCILFEMLTGRRAFPGETVPDVLAAILDRDPNWTNLPSRVPERVQELLHRCLEKDPARRLRDAGDARLELESALAGLSGAGRAAAVPRRLPWKTVAAALAGAAVAAAGYWILRPKPDGAHPAGVRHLAVLPFRNLIGAGEGELMGLALADTVSARLSDVPGLQVVTPRATVEAVDEDPDTSRVARRLGANTLLSGTLQRENERYRITYRLVDAAGNQIAANAIDGPALFALQDRVAEGVVRDLRLRPGARRTPAPSGLETAEQQDRYLQAIGHLLRYDKPLSVENAMRLLEALAAEAPSSALVQAALGRAYLYQFRDTRVRHWVDLAEEACSRAQRLDPDLPEVDVTLGSLRADTGRSADAIAAFRRSLSAQPNSLQALLGLARSFAASGQVSEAEATYRRAIELQPSFWASYNEFAAFYFERGDYARAAQMFRRVTELTPDNAMAFSNLGGALSLMGRFTNALEAYRASLELAPTDVAYSNLGTTQFLLGDYRESARSFEKAVGMTPGHFQLWANLGDAYRWTKRLEPRAAEAYSRAIVLAREELRVNPQNPTTHSYLALCLAKTSLPKEAREHTEKALAIAPENPEFLYNAAIVANLAGRQDDALKWIRSAAERGYGRPLIAREPEFANLRNNPVFRELVQTAATSS